MADELEPHPAQTGAPPAAQPVAAAGPGPRPINWPIAALALAGVVIGAGAVMMLQARTPAAAPTSASSAAVPRAPADPPGRPPVVARGGAPKWTGGVQRSRGRVTSVIYELQAENEVALFTRRVRPLLVVRCISRTPEVFVLTESAAAIEGSDGLHTVHVEYDPGSTGTEKWLASADYDALFARDGAGTARRIARARTMRFGFTPYNGTPATVEFDVRGLDSLLAKTANRCQGL